MAQPVVVFDNGFDWKQIFDTGLRPRHQNGGNTSCRVWNQPSFILKIKGLEGQMNFGKGNLSIDFDYKEKICGFSYFDAEAIDMEEGARRAEQLTKWLKPYIIHEMQMPRYVEGTYVDANVSSARLVAQMGEYRFSYRFVDTASPTKQLRGEFSVYHAFPGQQIEGFIPIDRKIKPPPGYEDWDMTEIIPTSNGDKRVESGTQHSEDNRPVDAMRGVQRNHEKITQQPYAEAAPSQNSNRLTFIIAGLCLIFVSLIYYALRPILCNDDKDVP
jgi:hypothetical protein